MKTQKAASEFPTLAAPQRELETSIQPLKKPTANHLLCDFEKLRRNPLQNFLNFYHHLRLTEHFSESQAAP
jgi:hypothetical protein